MEQSSHILCNTLHGATKLVPRASLVFRPAVYAVVLQGDDVLMITTQYTGKYFLPGGSVELGERMHTALKREVREETGLEIEVNHLLHVEEQFFFFDPTGEAWHLLQFFWMCSSSLPNTIDITHVDEEVAAVQWVNRHALRLEDVVPAAHNVVRLILKM